MVTPFRPGFSQVKGLFQPDLMSENMFFRLRAQRVTNDLGNKKKLSNARPV